MTISEILSSDVCCRRSTSSSLAMVGVVGRQGSGGSGVGPVLSCSGLVGLAVVILGSQVTLGAAQGEMAEAAFGAVADIFEGQCPEF